MHGSEACEEGPISEASYSRRPSANEHSSPKATVEDGSRAEPVVDERGSREATAEDGSRAEPIADERGGPEATAKGDEEEEPITDDNSADDSNFDPSQAKDSNAREHETSESSDQSADESSSHSPPSKRQKVACQYCDKEFLGSNMNRHLRAKHKSVSGIPSPKKNPRFTCRFCGENRDFYKKRTHYQIKHTKEWNEDYDSVSSTKTDTRPGNISDDLSDAETAIQPSAISKRKRVVRNSPRSSAFSRSSQHLGQRDSRGPKGMLDYRTVFMERQYDARDVIITMLEKYEGKAYSQSEASSFASISLPLLIQEINYGRVERPHVFADIERKLGTEGVGCGVSFLLLTRAEASKVLQSGLVKKPILVPAEFSDDASRPLSLETYIAQVKKMPDVYVHDLKEDLGDLFDADGDMDPYDCQYSTIAGSKAAKRVLEEDGMVLLLNLACQRRNPFPPFVADVADYDLLGPVHLPTHADIKGTKEKTPNVSFQMLGSEGAHTLPSTCPNGVISTFRVEEGECVFSVWPAISVQDYEKIADTTELNRGHFIIHLQPGDVLMLPSGTFYSTVFTKPTLITGNYYWHPQDLTRMIQLAWVERKRKYLPDEGRSGELAKEIQRVGKMWANNTPGWAWPSGDDERKIWTDTLLVRLAVGGL